MAESKTGQEPALDHFLVGRLFLGALSETEQRQLVARLLRVDVSCVRKSNPFLNLSQSGTRNASAVSKRRWRAAAMPISPAFLCSTNNLRVWSTTQYAPSASTTSFNWVRPAAAFSLDYRRVAAAPRPERRGGPAIAAHQLLHGHW